MNLSSIILRKYGIIVIIVRNNGDYVAKFAVKVLKTYELSKILLLLNFQKNEASARRKHRQSRFFAKCPSKIAPNVQVDLRKISK